jgi:hypothetical protein
MVDMESLAVIEIVFSLGGVLITGGITYGIVSTTVKSLKDSVTDLEEGVRHHVQSEHRDLSKDTTEVEKELAVLKAVSKLGKGDS